MPSLLPLGSAVAILDAVANGIQNSDTFALPARATSVDWQTVFGTAPASVTVLIQTSNDNSNWDTVATTTATAGAGGNIVTAALFIRARESAVSGGTTTTVYLTCKTVTVDQTVETNNPAGSDGQVQFNDNGSFGAIDEGTSGQVLTSNGPGVPPSMQDATGGGIDELTGDVTAGPGSGSEVATLKESLKTTTIGIVIDGGGAEIADGIAGDIYIPFACTIIAATLLADQTGSIVIDVWEDVLANYPPDDGDSITAAAPPTISSSTNSQDTTLTGWDVSVPAGSTMRFNVDSCTDIERVVLQLTVVIL